MPDLGFSWDILSPSPSGPTATSPAPLAAQTSIDLDTVGDVTSIVIHWGDGKSTTLTMTDEFEYEADHTYQRPGTYHATASSVPAGFSLTRTFVALGLNMKPKLKRVSFART